MGQASSAHGRPPPTLIHRHSATRSRRSRSQPEAQVHHTRNRPGSGAEGGVEGGGFTVSSPHDPTSDLPDECLAYIFLTLSSGDRKSCSLVCKRWLKVEGQSRQRLSLNAQSELISDIPALFTRFDSVTKLALRCDRRSFSIEDDALVLVSLRCRNLTRLKLRGCRQITDLGITAFAQNCKNLKKLSCGSCDFGTKGLNSVLEHCSLLEELSLKRLRGLNDHVGGAAAVVAFEPISPGQHGAAKSLRSICLKELYNWQVFGPLVVGAKNLRSLKLIKCMGDWDSVLESMVNSNDGLVEIHLERLQVSDMGLSAISNCPKLEILHVVKAPDCSNVGIVSIAEKCKLLRKVHIDGWRTNRIGDEALSALGTNCGNLQELVLIGLNPTASSLEVIASSCRNLERLALCSSETIRDAEILCIASKCVALKKFCIKSCPISDNGLEALAWGCPNLVKIKVKKCREVTHEILEWLRARRESLVVNLDVDEIEEAVDASDAGGGAPPPLEEEEDVSEPPTGMENYHYQALDGVHPPATASSNHRPPATLFRGKLGFLRGRKIAAACALRRWSSANGNGNSSSNTNQ
ncbi:Putative VIER F-box protein 2 [Dionaea muscipula]